MPKARIQPKTFFVSYTAKDRRWANWIASTLEDAGHHTVIQSWDFGVGSNFVAKMDAAIRSCDRAVLVYSNHYFESIYAQAEWTAAFARDPTGEILLPVRVEPCEPGGLLAPIVYCDLVELEESAARARLLAAATPAAKRSQKFPGETREPRSPRRDPGCGAVRELSDILSTTGATFAAQCNLRDRLVSGMRRRLQIRERLEYEAFFAKYFADMNDTERGQHGVVRAYTKNVLSNYNRRALALAEQIYKESPEAWDAIPSLDELASHLRLWLERYKAVIRSRSTCLVYVGVEEDAGFPTQVEDEIADFLEECCGILPRRRSRRYGARGESLER